ncbi:8143_t:CDS:2 [Gigaspora rosea]|nr:8143_t:CDS:2 [Gigaspora rosea]
MNTPRASRKILRKSHGLIHNDPGFSNQSKTLQRPVWQQLAVILERLGCNGNGASVGRFARQCGLGIGAVVQWPNSFERQQISNQIKQSSGFKGCVEVLDSTDVVHLH